MTKCASPPLKRHSNLGYFLEFFFNFGKKPPRAWVFFLNFWLEFCAWVLVFLPSVLSKKPGLAFMASARRSYHKQWCKRGKRRVERIRCRWWWSLEACRLRFVWVWFFQSSASAWCLSRRKRRPRNTRRCSEEPSHEAAFGHCQVGTAHLQVWSLTQSYSVSFFNHRTV